MIRVRRAIRLLPVVALFLLCASCSGFFVSNSSISSISLGPGAILKAATSTTPGDTDQLQLNGTTVGGTTTDVTASATWTSSNPAVATVGTPDTKGTTPGLVTVVGTSGNATVTITATYGGQTATSNVLTYTGAVPTSLTITIPSGISSGSLTPGQVFQLQAAATPSLSGVASQNVSSYVTWTSSNTSEATVDVNGNVTVLSTASVGGTFSISATTTISGTTVSSPNPGVQFTVI